MLPILVRPECSASAVIAATFHPERTSYFLLAFADGTAAVFDALHFFSKYDSKAHETRPAISGTGGVVAFVRGLHSLGTSTGGEASKLGISSTGVDAGTGIVGIGDKICGITAVAFVPGRKAMVITVGADGKCCIVDFTQQSRKRAILLKAWHLRRPATSLSVICSPTKSASIQADGTDDVPDPDPPRSLNENYCIAIGRDDGRVLLFDLNGKLLGEQKLGAKEAPVIDVEWTQDDDSEAGFQCRSSNPAIAKAYDGHADRRVSVPVVSSPSSSGPKDSTPRPLEVSEQYRELFDFSPAQHTIEVSLQEQPSNEQTTATNHSDLSQANSEGKITSQTSQSSDFAHTSPFNKTARRKVVLNPAKSSSRSSSNESNPKRSDPPPIPPRPSPRPGGLLSIRRSQSNYESPTTDSYATLIAKARRTKSNRPLKNRKLFGPRPLPIAGVYSSQSPPVASHNQSSPESVEKKSPISSLPSTSPDLETRKTSPAASVESFQTASSHLRSASPSERSTDTVIDWDVGSTRQPFPSLDETPQPLRKEAPQTGLKKRGHVSLSISSTSLETPVLASPASNNTVSQVIQWPEASPRYSASSLHASHAPVENPSQPKGKQKGHISILPSPASDTTITSITSASEGPIVQWPSLKKSPRIPELNKALSFSGRKPTTTGIALDSIAKTLRHIVPSLPPLKKSAIMKKVRSAPLILLLLLLRRWNPQSMLRYLLSGWRWQRSLRSRGFGWRGL